MTETCYQPTPKSWYRNERGNWTRYFETLKTHMTVFRQFERTWCYAIQGTLSERPFASLEEAKAACEQKARSTCRQLDHTIPCA